MEGTGTVAVIASPSGTIINSRAYYGGFAYVC